MGGHWAERVKVLNTTQTVKLQRGYMKITMLSADINAIVKRHGLGALLTIAKKVADDASSTAPVDNTPAGKVRRRRQKRNHLNKRIKASQTKRATYVKAQFPAYFVAEGHDIRKGGRRGKAGSRVVGRAEPNPWLQEAMDKSPQYVRGALGTI